MSSEPSFKEKIKYLAKKAHSFYDSKYKLTHKIDYCTDTGFFVTGLIFYNYSIVRATDKFLALTELKYEEKHYMFHNANGDFIRILKNGNYIIIDDKEDETTYDYLSANDINLQDILKALPKQFYNLYGKPVNSDISVMEAW